jgi:3D (Asp-Asp-Asp) domain-containing protein
MKKLILVFAVVVSFGFIFSKETKSFSEPNRKAMKPEIDDNEFVGYECSDGWRVTGYFTPIETEYDSTETKEIEIKNIGKIGFNAEFLKTIFDEDVGYGEGWGKTRFGWYLGNYNGKWHKADAPLDANNSPLDPNSVAVDNEFIPNDSEVKIPGLPGEFGKKTFIANDVGVSVEGKHIDVYCGEGKEAERKMWRVTFEDDNLIQVCFKKP